MQILLQTGIRTQVHFIPFAYATLLSSDGMQSVLLRGKQYYRRCLSLPLFVTMVGGDVDFVCEQLLSIVMVPELATMRG